MDVRLPDGTIISNVPEGISRAELTAKLQANGYDISGLVESTPSSGDGKPSVVKPTTKPTGDAYTQAIEGASNPLMIPVGLGEAGLQMVAGGLASILGGFKGAYAHAIGGKTWDEATKNVQGIQQALTYQPRSEYGKIASDVASTVLNAPNAPLSAVGGAAGGLFGKKARIAGETIGETATPIALTVLGLRAPVASIGKSVAKGEILPTMPSLPTWKHLPEVPVVSGLLRVGGDIVNSYLPGGAQRQAAKAIRKGMSYEEAQKIIDATNKYSGEVVPGSPVTAADVIARANEAQGASGNRFGSVLATQQADLMRMPYVGEALKTIENQQKQARANLADLGAGSDAQYAQAVNERIVKTKPLYDIVAQSQATADITPTLNKITSIRNSAPADVELQTALGRVQSGLLDESGAPRTNVGQLSSAIDDINTQLSGNIPSNVALKLVDLKKTLIKQISDAESAYGKAINAYREASVPINRMDVWRVLREKAVNAAGTETPRTLLKALQNEPKIIKLATDFNRGTSLKDLFGDQAPDAMRYIKEMTSEAYKKNMQKELDLGTDYAIKPQKAEIPMTFNKEFSIARFVINSLGKNNAIPMGQAAVRILKDPKLLAAELAKIPAPYRSGFIDGVKNLAKNPDYYATLAGGQPPQQGQQP